MNRWAREQVAEYRRLLGRAGSYCIHLTELAVVATVQDVVLVGDTC